MEQAIEEAVVIEEALKFGGDVSEVNVNAIQKKEDSGELGQLKTLLEQMVKKIDTLEAQMSEIKIGHRDMTTGRRHYQYERGGTQKCYRCGEQGHFKRACPLNFNKPAQLGGGNELAGKQVIHHGRRQIKEVHVYNINSLLQVEALLGGSSVKFLLDSGAAVSVVCYAVLSEEMQQRIKRSSSVVIGANGVPLEVVGRVTANVVLGTFHHDQEFIVVRELTVKCLLGADFMEKHGVVIDYRTRCIQLGQDLVEIPIIGSNTDRVTPPCSDKVVVVSEDVQIPGHSILLLVGKIKGDEGRGCIGEGLIEEGDVDGKPKNMLVARSLSIL